MVSSSSSSSASANVTDTVASTPVPSKVTTPVPSGVSSTASPTSKAVAVNAGDTCGCRASGLARTCFECLNMNLQDGETCAVNPYGACMASATAVAYESYFSASVNSTIIPHGNEFFWSSNATYCPTSDETCTECRAKWGTSYRMQSLRSNFSCVGAGGCVCSAYCELRLTMNDYREFDLYNAGLEVCAAGQSVAYGGSNSITTVRNAMSLAVGIAVFLLIVRQCASQFQQSQYNRRMRERHRVLREQRNATSRFGLSLTLEGWNGYREQLIEREQENFELKAEPLLTEAPIRVLVEEGECVRPGSPSQLATQQRRGVQA